MVVALDSPQPVFNLPDLADIPDTEEDVPEPGAFPREIGAMSLPEIFFGAASFSQQYNSSDHLNSTTPLRTVRLALRYGIKAFDTSTYYGPSEIVLGTALKTLEPEFPRSSYQLMTKCGRYGNTQAEFDYTPETIRRSVHRSLSRLNTTYLDTVYLHDAEYVCTQVQPRREGNHSTALTTEMAEYGLTEGLEGKIWGPGDQIILDAIAELRKLKQEGLIRHIGITGYPLPVLLRLSLLVLHTPPYEPLDVLLNYSHLNLQNSTFAIFLPHFRERARIAQLITASPLNMGLLTPSQPPWHPAPRTLLEASQKTNEALRDGHNGLPKISLGFAYRKAEELGIPTVVGLSKMKEVHETIRIWRELNTEGKEDIAKMRDEEGIALKCLEEFQGYSWASPP